MQPKKVIQVLYSGLGGHGSVAYSLYFGSQNKVKFYMVYFGIENLNPNYVELNQLHQIPYSTIVKKKGVDIICWANFINCLRKEKPEIVLLHSITLIIPALLFKWIFGCKLIAIEHNANQIKRKSEWWWTKIANRYCNKVVYLSSSYLNEVKMKIGRSFKAENSLIIPNGIDIEKFKPIQPIYNSEMQIHHLFMHSRFNEFRDHETLLRAFALLIEKHPTLKLVLAGDGVTKNLTEGLGRALNLSHKIHFLGNISEEKIILELQRPIIFTYASRAETMSTAIMQAMSCGVPIVATDIPGINNLIKNGSNAFLYQPNDYQELAEKIDFLMSHKLKRKELADAARIYAQSNFSQEKMFTAYNSVF